MNKITVYCGSSSGFDKAFKEQAIALGELLASKNIDLVYGGTDVGLMGGVANATMENGGKAIGVIPKFIRDFKLSHKHLSELIVVDTMHERKARMSELGDGYIALPGGFGTLEELFEMLTAAQLGLHTKPIALLNTNGFYNDLVVMIKSMIKNGFVTQINLDMLIVESDVEVLLDRMLSYVAPDAQKWKIV
jgi:hypothetical protein